MSLAKNHKFYAVFRFNGEIVNMNQRQFDQCIRDAVKCGCGNKNNNCLCCRTQQYWEDIRMASSIDWRK